MELGLALTLWEGEFAGHVDTWLRWKDAEGNLLLTGGERAAQEAERAERERERADREGERADREGERAERERERAERMKARLRELGEEVD